ncbi:MAG: hypothetical protein JW771_02755 [Candidatus Thermoplasmatota archaeon]|nr:hypothetical protein [Candidatus Thermoplasmatota archaeon]
MHRINVILDIDQEYLMQAREPKANRKGKQKHDTMIKLNDDLFEIALRKGLIEKTDDGYVFVGDYEELLAFKKKK